MKSMIKYVVVPGIRMGFLPDSNKAFNLIEDSLREKAEGHLRFHGELITEEAIELYVDVVNYDFSHRVSTDPVIKQIGLIKELEMLERLHGHDSLGNHFINLGKKFQREHHA